MIIYSVTVTVDQTIESDWVAWMCKQHIPDVMATGFFHAAHLQRLMDPIPESGLTTFNIQYECESLEAYQTYRDTVAPKLQQAHQERYADRFVAFRTLLRREDSFE